MNLRASARVAASFARRSTSLQQSAMRASNLLLPFIKSARA